MASRRKRALEMLEPDPLPLFFVHSGFRFVLPQYYTHHIYAKGRWLRPAADGSPQSYLSLMTAEFPSYTDQYHPLALRSSRVLVNSAPVRPSDPVRPGDLLTHRVHHHEPPSTAELPALLCSTDRFLVVSKPAGLATHASGVILHGTLLRALTDMSRAHPGILSPPSESSDVAPAAVSAAVGASPSPAVSIAPPPTGADENPPRGGPPSSLPWVPPPLGEYSVYRSFSSASASSSSAAPGGHSAGGFHPAHRLDRATSGVIVLARDAPAATGLGAVFAERAEKATSSAGAGDEDDCGQYDVATLLSDTFYTDAPALSGTAKESTEEPSTQQEQDGKPYVRKSYLARVRGRFPRSAADAGLLPCGHPPLFREPTRPASSEGESKGGEWFLVRVPVKSVGMAKSFQAVPLPQLSSFLSSSSAPAAASIGADACPLCTGSAAWQEPSGVETSTPTTPATDENNSSSSGGVWPGPVLAAAAARDTAWDGPPSMWPPMKEAVSAFRLVRTDSSDAADDGVTSLVECVPLTGRTHQLRVHLWWLGTPIANDAAYGGVPCRGDCAPPLANVPWPGVAGITPAAAGGDEEQQAQESTAGGWDAPLETSNGTIAPVAFIPAHIASSSPQPADSSAFWSPLLASKADLAAWASSTKAETVRAVAAVAADEDGYDARHSTEAGEHICSSGEEKNEEEGEAGTGPDPWCPSCVRFARTRRSRPAVPSQNSEGKTVDAAAAAARNVSLAGNTFRIWLHAWRLRARGSLPPAPAPIAAAGGHNSGVGRKNRGKNANGNAPREPFAIDVVAPAPEWAGETFDAAEWLREPLAKSPRNYPFVWGNKE